MSRTKAFGGIIFPLVVLCVGALWWHTYLRAFPYTIVAAGLFEPSRRLQEKIECGQWHLLSGDDRITVRECKLELTFHVLWFQQEKGEGQSQPSFMPGRERWTLRNGRVIAATSAGFVMFGVAWTFLWRWLTRIDKI